MKSKKELKEIAKKIAAIELILHTDQEDFKNAMFQIESLTSELEDDPEQLIIVDELVQKILEKKIKNI